MSIRIQHGILCFALGAFLLGSVAEAAPRTESSLCSVMKATIQKNGTLIRRYRGRDTRFVAHSGFCDHGTVITWRIPTARDGRCPLKICEEVTHRRSR